MIFRSIYKRPILLAGNGVRSSGAQELIREFTERTKIPVLTSMNAVDLIQDKNKIGFIGTYGNRAANMIVSECDLLIAAGIRLGLRQIGKYPQKFAPNAKLIRADIDQNELSRSVKPDEEKHLIDAKSFITELLNEKIPDYSAWQSKCFELRDLLDDYDDLIGNKVIKKISSLLPLNPIVAVDVGQNMCWCAQSLTLKGRGGRILLGGSYGSMGCGLPYAVGASISSGNAKVFCITGDGGLQMNIQELETIAREKLPIKIIVINNNALGKISEVQAKSYDSRFAQTTKESGYSVPDFEKISTAYGIKAVTLKLYEMIDKYTDWFADDDPCLLNILLPSGTLLIPKMEFKTMDILPKLDEDTAKKCKKILEGSPALQLHGT